VIERRWTLVFKDDEDEACGPVAGATVAYHYSTQLAVPIQLEYDPPDSKDYGSYETYEDSPAPDFSHGPDLVHEGAADDFGHHEAKD